MSIFSIAFNNFKNNIKTYTMFFISMIFSVIILNNFIILLDGEALTILGENNVVYTKMILRMISLILGIFMFFFIWYTSNVFLRNRKKEIGLFTFMGVDLRTIGKIYFTEMMLIGLSSCVIGIGTGALFSKFFQMIVFAVANFNVDVKFEVTGYSIVSTFLIFMAIFLVMSIKGFINIASSKVIDLLNDSKKTEKMPKITVFTYIIAIISIGLISYGYYLVFSSKMNAVKTLVLVCIGTYGLFYAAIPIVLNSLINNKKILYKGENIITINSLAYRIKKNYTTYATIVILTACTITVLGTSVSMRKLYSMSEENDQLFTMSFSSSNTINNEEISEEVTKVLGEKKFDLNTDVLMVKDKIQEGKQKYIVLPYDKFTSILKSNGYEKDLENVNEGMVQGDKVIYIQRPGTLATLFKKNNVTVGDQTFEISESDIRFKVLGSLINYPAVVVNNSQYEKLKNSGEMLNFYGIKAKDDKELLNQDTLDKLGMVLKPYLTDDINFQVGIYKTKNVEWLKLVYAIGTFLFLVFILAEASIIYIKIYSDANDDKDKYKILKNIGVSKKDLRRAIRKEVSLFYILPLSIGLLHSFFAIQALGRFLSENLNLTFIISVLVSICIFFISAIISNKSFKSIVKV